MFRYDSTAPTTLSLFMLACALESPNAVAQGLMEEVVVTAQKREESIQDVSLSVARLAGESLDSKFTGGDTVLALAGAVPGLYAESSGGRTAPRFYMRGLGNPDFNPAASQPVSVVMDEVPMEKSTFKSFPVFDVQSIEVIRGPQGTLYGRNTTAGIIKFDSNKPTDDLEGYVRTSVGNLGTFNFEGAMGGSLIDNVLSGRISVLSQNRSNWIDNTFTGKRDAIGGFDERAGRAQLLWTPTDRFSALLLHQRRDLGGNTSSAFRANILSTGSNDLNGHFDRDKVNYDGGDNQRAEADGSGTNLTLTWDRDGYTLTSITSHQEATRFSRSDVDGGVCNFCGDPSGPGNIPFPVDTASDSDLEQLSQELRFTSLLDGPLNYQAGFFYFEDELNFVDLNSAEPAAPTDSIGVRSSTFIENTTWAVFAQADYDLTDALVLTAGIRYTDDEKTARYAAPPSSSHFDLARSLAPVKLGDNDTSLEASLAYQISDASQVYGRIASGFRAPTIQTTLNADPDLTTADSETILSYELGYKAELADKVRLNSAVFYYVVDDLQLTAVGGESNSVRLLNAEEGVGYGIELDVSYFATESLLISGGFGYNKTEYRDDGLATEPCGSGMCTVLDPIDANGNAVIDGNPFLHAPKWNLNFEVSYTHPLANGDELFVYTDWKVKGETNDFLYESTEYITDTQFEGGLRLGYRGLGAGYEIALFSRNITDEANVTGGIDFNNLTAYVNEPRIWGLEASYRFQ
ncbi:TonB-dependent receptor [Parahaliea mediterranea]|uniref:TonB-dependent receptor n=1 Tax=Parahaliea mediterranea TaxID=651086 RepID=A0A939DGC3_9GAMM|nr:TonB-dependent receptor [Parahaliea mediterranea]MBN7797704.1 TonB-dependent receptor [Parahaliea mediterranea]